jgi:cell division septation protein DedD
MEKKHATLLLVLVLAVSLVSFSLGVMVGKSVGRSAPAVVSVPPERLPVRDQVSVSPEPAPGTEKESGVLTFYDSLPKGEQTPLGSGINVPAEQGKATVSPGPAKAKVTEPAKAKVTEPAVPRPEPKQATASPKGSNVVQVASFREAGDARTLQEKLSEKGYASFMQRVELGEKGTWHRVYLGPYTDTATAEKTAQRLQAEEKMAGLIRKL